MTHETYNPVEYENLDPLSGIVILEDDSLSVSGVSAHNLITVQAPFDVIFYYTTNGTEPTISSYLYTNPISIETTTSGEIVSARILSQNLKTLETAEQTLTAGF
jgi:hypothetical protein